MNVLYWILGGINLLMWGWAAAIYSLKGSKIGRLAETKPEPEPKVVRPLISVVIAARNEQKALESCIRSLAVQSYERVEIIVVDDRSSDGTGEIIKRMEAEFPQVTGFQITELPEGWMGKSHALHEGVKLAKGEWLLFTDGDILFHPECLAKAETSCRKEEVDHLSLIPDFKGSHLFSKWYGAYIFSSASSFGMLWKAKDPKAPQTLGVGAFNLLRRSAYEAIGTHAAFAYVTTDDNELAKRVKKFGLRQNVMYGSGMIAVWNWYESLRQLIGSVEKSLFTPGKAVMTTVACMLTMLYPWAGLFLGPIGARVLCGLSLLSVFWLYFRYSRHAGGGAWYGLAHPLIGLCLIAGGVRGAYRAKVNGGMTWRGTTYNLNNLKS
ncbi:Poly-beta-1,6-N-acetyl-D-glucosamine synthase [compost metagenome]